LKVDQPHRFLWLLSFLSPSTYSLSRSSHLGSHRTDSPLTTCTRLVSSSTFSSGGKILFPFTTLHDFVSLSLARQGSLYSRVKYRERSEINQRGSGKVGSKTTYSTLANVPLTRKSGSVMTRNRSERDGRFESLKRKENKGRKRAFFDENLISNNRRKQFELTSLYIAGYLISLSLL